MTIFARASDTLKMENNPQYIYDKNQLIRTFVKGGMVSPGNLLAILDASALLGNDFVLFGSREDILFPVCSDKLEEASKRLEDNGIDFQQGKRELFQNVVTSAIALGITNTSPWLNLGHYHYILKKISHRPRLKINIVDPQQSMVALFTGHLNFIASANEQYWHLYIRKEGIGHPIEKWPVLIQSADIGRVCIFIEDSLLTNPKMALSDLVTDLAEYSQLDTLSSSEPLLLSHNFFPYYEGMNNMDENMLWLGLYWRNNRFDKAFLQKACNLCLDADIPYLYISPWKSFVIKGIKQEHQLEWEKVMGQFGINMRHSSLELNWHIPVLDEEALSLKRYLVQELDLQDICTHGLTFTVVTENDKLWFTSVVIQQDHSLSHHQKSLFHVYYAKDFNPNTTIFYPYAKHVEKEIIPSLLIELSKLYYQSFRT